LFVGDWQTPSAQFNPFDDDATTLVGSNQSYYPSEFTQLYNEDAESIHKLPIKRKFESLAEHKKTARSEEPRSLIACAG